MVHNSEWDREDPDTEQFGEIIESTTAGDAGAYEAVLVGEPYDGGTVGRAGARDGPGAIRAALSHVESHHLDAGPVGSLTVANVAGLFEESILTDGGYRTDGGFGEDEESVGDVEHFDPTVEESDDADDGDEADTDEESAGETNPEDSAGDPEETNDDTLEGNDGSAVDDTAFAMSDSEAETEVIESTGAGATGTESGDSSSGAGGVGVIILVAVRN